MHNAFLEPTPLVVMLAFLALAVHATAQPPLNGTIQGSVNKDRLTNSVMHTLPLEAAVADHKTGADGQQLPSRVISTISPVVVRQNDRDGPKYQEALGYSFLLNSPKYPGLCRMDDGTLVLTMTAALSGEIVADASGVQFVDENTRTDVILYSKDNGLSWSQPRRIPGYRTTPMDLGGNRLMIRGYTSKIDVPAAYHFWFSDDAGATWGEPELVSKLPDGSDVITDVAMNFPREGDEVRFMFFHNQGNADRTGTVMRPYNFVKHTWGDPTFFPRSFMSSEASLARARNGDLVGVFRSGREGIPAPSDHWRGIVTGYSTDDGRTWTGPFVNSLYGHVHHSLVTFPDGRILMTYAARLGELDGRLYHGCEAVISHDHGRTWDWPGRFILFRWPDGSMHSPKSVIMDDGRVLTVVMHHTSYTWRDKQTHGNLLALSNVSVVIWNPGKK
jgi:hypothetical protein